MSYTICFGQTECPHCGRAPADGDDDYIAGLLLNPTYSYSEMIYLAFKESCGMTFDEYKDGNKWCSWLNKKTGAETSTVFAKVSAWAHDPHNEDRIQKLAPENGWGTVDGFRKVFSTLAMATHAHPDFVFWAC